MATLTLTCSLWLVNLYKTPKLSLVYDPVFPSTQLPINMPDNRTLSTANLFGNYFLCLTLEDVCWTTLK